MNNFDLSRIDRLWRTKSKCHNPPTTLRGGMAIDSHKQQPTYDTKLDYLTNEYLRNLLTDCLFWMTNQLIFIFHIL